MYSRMPLACAPVIGCLIVLAPCAPLLAQVTLDGDQRALLDEYCVSCHNFDDFAGSLDLSALLDEQMPGHAETWEKVIRKLRAGMMPPPGQPRPAWNTYNELTASLENTIDSNASLNPGAVPMHRLNRLEYANAIRAGDRHHHAAAGRHLGARL
jgi:hypothetical protein